MSTSWTRQRVSQACKICQAKKIKCGGELPECNTCVRQNKKCFYGISKRNTRRTTQQPTARARASAVTPQPQVAAAPTPDKTSVSVASSERQSEPVSLAGDASPLPITPGQSVQLFERYFRHIHPIWPLLYKPIYDSIGYHGLSEHLPKCVVFAIYAIASCLHDEQELDFTTAVASEGTTTPPLDSSANHFFESALLELQYGKQGKRDVSMMHALRPSISYCQTLTILALQQHGVAEFTRASLFCSLAATMAIDLRLHRSAGQPGSVEREVGSRLWWNIYVLEKMMSFEMGRPMAWRFDEADAPFPSTQESDEFELFKPPSQGGRDSRGTAPLQKLQTLTAFHTTIDLCRLMERISCDIYSLRARQLIKESPASGDATRMELWRDVQDWRLQRQSSSLSLDLGHDGVTLPVVVTNHVQICSVTILLHRPFISPWLQHLSLTGQPLFNTESPLDICYQAAEDICGILESYSRYIPQLPCDLIFPIFTAASTLLHQLRNSTTEVAGRQERLKLCLSWLSVFSKNWRNARERVKMLHELYDSPGTPFNRNSPPLQTHDSHNRSRWWRSSSAKLMTGTDTEHLDYLHSLGTEETDSDEGCPDFNMDFWMFLEGQQLWSE